MAKRDPRVDAYLAKQTSVKDPPSKRELISLIKGEDTRARRVKQAVQWMAKGKARNWKYM